MWFAALGTYQGNPWLIHLIDKLLEDSPSAKTLLDVNRHPFPNAPPKMIRVQKYHYDFTRWNTSWARSLPSSDILESLENSTWWTRTLVGDYVPPLEHRNPSLSEFLHSHDWNRQNGSSPLCTCDMSSITCQLCSHLDSFHATPKRPYVVVGFVVLIASVVCSLLEMCWSQHLSGVPKLKQE